MRLNCTIPACDTQHRAKGYCQKHYQRWRKHGDPLVSTPRIGNTNALGYRHTPEAKARISAANKGKVLSVSARDKVRAAMKGTAHARGAVRSSATRAKIGASRSASLGSTHQDGPYTEVKTPNGWEKEHRVVMGVGLGDPRVVHHRDGDKANNNPANLRIYETQAAHIRHHRNDEPVAISVV